MTNMSKTETTKCIQQTVMDKDVIYIEEELDVDTMKFALFLNKSPYINLEFILNRFSRKNVIHDLKQKPSKFQYFQIRSIF